MELKTSLKALLIVFFRSHVDVGKARFIFSYFYSEVGIILKKIPNVPDLIGLNINRLSSLTSGVII